MITLRKLIRECILSEGIYDPGILKAVFMAGGPGSGKSHTAKEVFGGNIQSAVAAATGSGLKLVNSDPAFEVNLEKAGISPRDLASMPDEEFVELTTGPDSPRGRAKRTRNAQLKGYMAGRLGVVIDGTGDDVTKIKAKKAEMEKAGYDTIMIFVNTSLDVAQQRNANRKRQLKPELVEDIWSDVQENMGAFQSLFGGSNFVIVDNTEYGPVSGGVKATINAFIKRPIENPIGRTWIDEELSKKGSKAERPRQRWPR